MNKETLGQLIKEDYIKLYDRFIDTGKSQGTVINVDDIKQQYKVSLLIEPVTSGMNIEKERIYDSLEQFYKDKDRHKLWR